MRTRTTKRLQAHVDFKNIRRITGSFRHRTKGPCRLSLAKKGRFSRTLSVRQEEEAYAPNTWPVVVSTTIIVEPWPAQSRVKVARELPCTELENSSTQSFTCRRSRPSISKMQSREQKLTSGQGAEKQQAGGQQVESGSKSSSQ